MAWERGLLLALWRERERSIKVILVGFTLWEREGVSSLSSFTAYFVSVCRMLGSAAYIKGPRVVEYICESYIYFNYTGHCTCSVDKGCWSNTVGFGGSPAGLPFAVHQCCSDRLYIARLLKCSLTVPRASFFSIEKFPLALIQSLLCFSMLVLMFVSDIHKFINFCATV